MNYYNLYIDTCQDDAKIDESLNDVIICILGSTIINSEFITTRVNEQYGSSYLVVLHINDILIRPTQLQNIAR